MTKGIRKKSLKKAPGNDESLEDKEYDNQYYSLFDVEK